MKPFVPVLNKTVIFWPLELELVGLSLYLASDLPPRDSNGVSPTPLAPEYERKRYVVCLMMFGAVSQLKRRHCNRYQRTQNDKSGIGYRACIATIVKTSSAIAKRQRCHVKCCQPLHKCTKNHTWKDCSRQTTAKVTQGHRKLR